MIAAGMADAEDIFGGTSFTLEGKTYLGILNEYEGEQEIELDGMLASYNATLVCQKPQFKLLAKPLQSTLRNKTITIDGVNYKVSRVAVDSGSVTLGLRIQR
jgi:hypothetical protein